VHDAARPLVTGRATIVLDAAAIARGGGAQLTP
jgi:2-C-methyl-D-erythritol 4-phosphate cytidylyltransferase